MALTQKASSAMRKNAVSEFERSEFNASDIAQPERSYRVLNPNTLELRHWLEVSWFLPEEFNKESITEDARYVYAHGAQSTYRFQKGDVGESVPVQTRWQEVLQEISDTEPLAPGYTLGVRPLRWVDGEPEWLSDEPMLELHSDAFLMGTPPIEANDFAVIFRRVHDELRMDQQLQLNGELSRRQREDLCTVMTDFHRRAIYRAKRLLRNDARLIEQILKKQVLRHLQIELQAALPKMDRLLQIGCMELFRFISGYFDRARDQLGQRGAQGWVTDIHGAMKSEFVHFERFHPRLPKVVVLGRYRHHLERSRLGDVLRDVASVCHSVATHGFAREAEKISETFVKHEAEFVDEKVLAFYSVIESLQSIVRKFEHPHVRKEDCEVVDRSLQFGLRQSHCVRLPVSFLVQVPKNSEDTILAPNALDSVAELSDSISRLYGIPKIELQFERSGTSSALLALDSLLPALVRISASTGMVVLTQESNAVVRHLSEELQKKLTTTVFVLRLLKTRGTPSPAIFGYKKLENLRIIDVETQDNSMELAFESLEWVRR